MCFQDKQSLNMSLLRGKPWMHETIIAPFDFSILKSDNQIEKGD